tara:strand:- start:14641 stop:15681 length:1041 start_codon:yes stop_codon:yes gene_type:complete
MNALTFENISVYRGKRQVLSIPHLEIAVGERLALLGPNGSGKSTLLLVGALLLDSAEGSMTLFDQPISKGKLKILQRRNFATVLQEPALLDMTVERNIDTVLKIHQISHLERQNRIQDWLSRLGIQHLAKAMPHQLSGGEAQRVAIARAFSTQPRILFLDEPFSSLDPRTRAELSGDLRGLLDSEAVTTLLVTHDLNESTLFSDRVAIMDDGKIAAIGSLNQIDRYPSTPAVSDFLGHTLIKHNEIPEFFLKIFSFPDSSECISVNPEGIKIVAGSTESTSVNSATIHSIQTLNGSARLILNFEGILLVSKIPLEDLTNYEIGSTVNFIIDPNSITFFGQNKTLAH